jgi:hypothetical protein
MVKKDGFGLKTTIVVRVANVKVMSAKKLHS